MTTFTRFSNLLVVLFVLASSFAVAAKMDIGGWPVGIVPAHATLSQGQMTTVSMEMNLAGTSATTVYLTSSDPSLLAVPSSVTVPAGSTSWQFPAASMTNPIGLNAKMKTKAAKPGTTVTITATANGHSAYTNVTVQ